MTTNDINKSHGKQLTKQALPLIWNHSKTYLIILDKLIQGTWPSGRLGTFFESP